jgi:hypothetical protein
MALFLKEERSSRNVHKNRHCELNIAKEQVRVDSPLICSVKADSQ